MKRLSVILLLFLALATGYALIKPSQNKGSNATVQYFKSSIPALITSAKALKTSIENISDSTSTEHVRQKLIACRNQYKTVEFFVEYFFGSTVSKINLPPVFEVEEPITEYHWPVGFQVIEDLLFDEDPVAHKKEMLDNATVILLAVEGYTSLLYGRTISDEEVLESLRLELIRIAVLNISGFDAPLLKTGISESRTALRAFNINLRPYLNQSSVKDSITHYISIAGQLLARDDFDSFDRMEFLTTAMLPLQRLTNQFIQKNYSIPQSGNAINYNAAHIFDKSFLNVSAFDSLYKLQSKPVIDLGKKLFFEKKLSGNGKRSCASCHHPDKYFTDGLKQSIAFDEVGIVRRNAPSILYTAYQYIHFWDGRAISLSDQVQDVMSAPNEMNADINVVVNLLKKDRRYRKHFRKAFPDNPDNYITADNIKKAIAAFEQSLPVMTSPFDKYIAGEKTAMTDEQIKGFNLFLGKGQCGTCHFAPVFNGLLPPLYDLSELESLGVTTNADFTNPVADADSGRFHIMPSPFYVGLFKTPTVRNAAKTAPYFHNGSLNNLTELVSFYNLGGGAGMGLHFPHQSLSNRPLNLSDDEIAALVSFMEALTDEPLWLKN